MDELEKEKEEAGAKASKVEAQVKQVEKYVLASLLVFLWVDGG